MSLMWAEASKEQSKCLSDASFTFTIFPLFADNLISPELTWVSSSSNSRASCIPPLPIWGSKGQGARVATPKVGLSMAWRQAPTPLDSGPLQRWAHSHTQTGQRESTRRHPPLRYVVIWQPNLIEQILFLIFSHYHFNQFLCKVTNINLVGVLHSNHIKLYSFAVLFPTTTPPNATTVPGQRWSTDLRSFNSFLHNK